MSLDELSIDDSESWSHSAEWTKEKSEKQKESSKKAQSQLQKTRKDEQKAKGDNDALFQILLHFVKSPYYEELIPNVTTLLEKGFSSRYILSLVGLVYPDAAMYLFTAVGQHEKAIKMTHLYRYESEIQFHEENIHPSLREWISLWVSAVEKFLTFSEVSVITSQKLFFTLNSQERYIAISAAERFFRFFFVSRNVLLPEKQARQYASFITDLIMKALEKSLEWADIDLKSPEEINEKDLFGI